MTLAPVLAAALAASAPAGPPLTLDDALAEAARANHDLRIARVERDRARTDVYGSYSGVLPRLDLSAGFGRSFFGAQEGLAAQEEGNHQLALVLRQPIFDGFASWRRIAAAKAGERAAERQLDEGGLAIAFDVVRRFYEVVKADESVRVLEETVRRSEEVLARAEGLFEAGRAPKTDVIAAQVNLENDRINAEVQRGRAALARADLAEALGRDAREELRVVLPSTVTGPLPGAGEPPPLDALAALARSRRPLLAARQELVTASERSLEGARGAYWPVLSAQAAYTRSATELGGGDGVFGNPARQYVATAQLVLSWNLFSGREITANARRAEADVRRSAIELEQSETQVAAELARARATAVALGRAARIAQTALAAAEEGQRAARERFEVGVANQLEIRDAELKLTQARLALLNARVDEVVARADLARATGGALE
jgi:outer membrane protein